MPDATHRLAEDDVSQAVMAVRAEDQEVVAVIVDGFDDFLDRIAIA